MNSSRKVNMNGTLKKSVKNSQFKIFFLIGGIPLLLGFLGKYYWLFDLFAHFRIYYVIYFLILGSVTLALQRRKEATVAMLFAVTLSFGLIKFYVSNTESQNISSETLKIASINLLSSNENFEKVASFIDEGSFDIVFLLEINDKWQHKIETIEGYPFQFYIPRPDNFGIGVIYNIEIDSVERIDVSNIELPSILLSMKLDGKELKLLSTHPVPPISSKFFEFRNNQFDEINTFVNEVDEELVLIGDFNSTVFSPNMKTLLNNDRLVDSRIGFGLLHTWNDLMPINLITLDHAFVTNGINVFNRGVGRSIGSDHLPIILEIGIK